MRALVGDIGGTNARFGLVETGIPGPPVIGNARTVQCADYDSLAVAVEDYLASLDLDERPQEAALAVACPVAGDDIKLTNSAWRFSRHRLKERLGLRRLEVLNDFAATAQSLPFIGNDSLVWIGQPADPTNPRRQIGGPLAVCGPGTGLGVAALIQTGERDVVLPSEGGHMAFAPLTATEFGIAENLAGRLGRVSYERVLSGDGLCNLYAALADSRDQEPNALTPAQITDQALTATDELCREVLEAFCAILGSFAGDVALMVCARQMYIAGGIAPRITDFLQASQFRARFEAKGRFRDMMAAIPTAVIVEPRPALTGAAAYLRNSRSPITA